MSTEISGARFGRSGFIILFESYFPSRDVRFDELFLRVESRWALFPSPPQRLPEGEQDIPAWSLSEQLSALAALVNQKVNDVALGPNCPHLLLKFDSGAYLIFNGHHERYECWELATIGGQPMEYRIVALPGDCIDLGEWQRAAVTKEALPIADCSDQAARFSK
jgi:hypothetical protein